MVHVAPKMTVPDLRQEEEEPQEPEMEKAVPQEVKNPPPGMTMIVRILQNLLHVQKGPIEAVKEAPVPVKRERECTSVVKTTATALLTQEEMMVQEENGNHMETEKNVLTNVVKTAAIVRLFQDEIPVMEAKENHTATEKNVLTNVVKKAAIVRLFQEEIPVMEAKENHTATEKNVLTSVSKTAAIVHRFPREMMEKRRAKIIRRQ
ncbi:MAG: hypothetical protein IPM91_09845 [Bacteroidetes bacterium]|nr:hypothetical protein [Bacteroidota bacterium]